jgi:hypothetical protein
MKRSLSLSLLSPGAALPPLQDSNSPTLVCLPSTLGTRDATKKSFFSPPARPAFYETIGSCRYRWFSVSNLQRALAQLPSLQILIRNIRSGTQQTGRSSLFHQHTCLLTTRTIVNLLCPRVAARNAHHSVKGN